MKCLKTKLFLGSLRASQAIKNQILQNLKTKIFKECDATLGTILPNCACISTFWEPPPLQPEKPFEVAVSWIHFRFLLYIECINSTSYSRFLDIV